MRKSSFLILVFLAACSANTLEDGTDETTRSSSEIITSTSFEFINTSENIEVEDFTDKKTIILFWADY
tara:strand:+ start:294 stop:497 length:204 start_codon:yes stop_codon:yes gene_type:complete